MAGEETGRKQPDMALSRRTGAVVAEVSGRLGRNGLAVSERYGQTVDGSSVISQLYILYAVFSEKTRHRKLF